MSGSYGLSNGVNGRVCIGLWTSENLSRPFHRPVRWAEWLFADEFKRGYGIIKLGTRPTQLNKRCSRYHAVLSAPTSLAYLRMTYSNNVNFSIHTGATLLDLSIGMSSLIW